MKAAAALIAGGLTTYLVQRRKEKANKMAQEIANSEFWRNEVKEIKAYTDEKIKDLTKKMDTCYEELASYQRGNRKD